MKRKVISTSFHRNGITGTQFYLVLFKDEDGLTKIAISFEHLGEPKSEPPIAVLDVARLAANDLETKFRGDHYADFVRQTLQEANGHISCIGTPAHSCGADSTHVDQQGYTICAECAKERKKDGRENRRMTESDREALLAGKKVAY